MFCSKCGAKIQDGSKFCSECGSAVIINKQIVQNEERKKEFIGNVRKCPVCGEEITSFTAICPACGHELNSAKVSDTLAKFIEQVKTCEDIINEQDIPASGWASWDKNQRIWWVVANVFLLGMPIAVTFILPFVTRKMPKLTKEEKQLSSLIENFPFPNNRESILEAIVYAKEKIDFISKQNVTSKSAYWMGLWCSKAEQLKQKADLMFPNDLVVKQSYAEILDDEKRVNGVIRNKAIIGAVILVAVLGYCFIRNGTVDDIKTANKVVEIPETELSLVMPKIEGGKGEVVTNNEEHFTVEYYGISETGFEDYKKECKKQGYTIDVENTGSLFDAFNDEGYNIRVTYSDSSKKLHVSMTDNMDLQKFIWPDSVVAKLLPVPTSDQGQLKSSSDTCLIIYVGNTTFDEYKEYVNACIKKGFSKNMSQTDDHYHADNADGYGVQVDYRGYNTIFIRIDD
ncbi:MAG: zinc ribbon domain-containing protein [Lachnospiraceae bacterium]|nr:zinc ribbon domain-containing protein [Lachnospiraceae bacterium]